MPTVDEEMKMRRRWYFLWDLDFPKEAWPETLVSGLLAEGFQVITPDNRDAGESTHMTSWPVSGRDVFEAIAKTMIGRPVVGEYALEDMALDLERLLDRLSIRRAHVVGISMGGMIAQVLPRSVLIVQQRLRRFHLLWGILVRDSEIFERLLRLL